MIIGIGSDLVDIRRIKAALDRHGARFITRCFAPNEQIYKADDPQASSHYAKRFAAKEAAAKAIGTGIDIGVYLKDMTVSHGINGAPALVLSGGAAAACNARARGGSVNLHISLSDEYPYALAFVVIEAI